MCAVCVSHAEQTYTTRAHVAGPGSMSKIDIHGLVITRVVVVAGPGAVSVGLWPLRFCGRSRKGCEQFLTTLLLLEMWNCSRDDIMNLNTMYPRLTTRKSMFGA